MTLVELMVGITIASVLMLAAAPTFSDYIRNARLRDSGTLLYAQVLRAQSEAVKRNTTVRLAGTGSVIQVLDRTDPDNPVLLSERRLSPGISMSDGTVDFGGNGVPRNLASTSIDLSASAATCNSTTRCPGLRVDGGGGVRLCANHLESCP